MARLSASDRAALPDRAFAYVDASGRRRLPLVDAAHVRNALARFDQVAFESDAAREQALRRLLAAARRFRIVPVGFVERQLRSARGRAPSSEGDRPLPTGFVTLLMTDIEGSTPLLAELGDDYADVLEAVRELHRVAVDGVGGVVVEARADEHFAAFASPRAAVEAAVSIVRAMSEQGWAGGRIVRVRAGLHAGYPRLSGRNYVGMPVHATARVCEAAHGGQIVISGDVHLALEGHGVDGVRFRSLGAHRLRGIPGEVRLLQVVASGLGSRFPPLRT